VDTNTWKTFSQTLDDVARVIKLKIWEELEKFRTEDFPYIQVVEHGEPTDWNAYLCKPIRMRLIVLVLALDNHGSYVILTPEGELFTCPAYSEGFPHWSKRRSEPQKSWLKYALVIEQKLSETSWNGLRR
jgi:hypothetical protein